jgi:hypothetical protein
VLPTTPSCSVDLTFRCRDKNGKAYAQAMLASMHHLCMASYGPPVAIQQVASPAS